MTFAQSDGHQPTDEEAIMRFPLHDGRRARAVALVATGALALLLAGCGGGSTDSSVSAGGAEPAAGVADGSVGGQSFNAAAKEGAGTRGAVAAAAAADTIRTASLSLRVKDVPAAAGSIRSLAASAGGLVTAENLSSSAPYEDAGSEAKDLTGSIVISVPSSKLDDTLTQLGKIGSITDRQVSSQNVHAQIVDTQSRIDSLQASVDRLRALMKDAKDINQIVSLESELTQRESDLEAMKTQLATIKDQVAMSPITVQLWTTVAPDLAPASGFVAGLKSGWNAFVTTFQLLVTALGALLPFAIVLLVIGYPLARYLRHRRAARPAAPALAAPAPAPAAVQPQPEYAGAPTTPAAPPATAPFGSAPAGSASAGSTEADG